MLCMSEHVTYSTLIPGIPYKDADAAIDWLKRALGFRERAMYRNHEGIVQHAELLFGESGMLMLGTAGASPQSAQWQSLPSELGNRVTGSTYLIVPDCTPVWQKALAAKAVVLMDLRTMDYGGQSFTVRDPEGHVWSVGEYDPWAATAG